MANVTVYTEKNPSDGGTVSGMFDSASGIYMASATPKTGRSQIGWTLKCEYCGRVLDSFGPSLGITIDINNYSGHPGPFVVTCFFSGATLVGTIELTKFFRSNHNGHNLQPSIVINQYNAVNHQNYSFALSAPATIDYEGDIWRFLYWRAQPYGVNYGQIVSKSNFNSNEASVVIRPYFYTGDVSKTEERIRAFAYYGIPSLLYGSSSQLIHSQSNNLVWGGGKVVDSNGDEIPLHSS